MPDPNNLSLIKYPVSFMLIPKVANTSIKIAMLEAVGVNLPHQTAINHQVNTIMSRGDTIVQEDKYRLLNAYNDHLKIAFVRNPYDRILSCYKNKVVQYHHRAMDRHGIPHKCSFDTFINKVKDIDDYHADQHFRSQYHELYVRGELVPDYVGRYETINDDWKEVQSMVESFCGMKLPALPHVNRTTVAVNVPISKHLQDIIVERYRNDFEAFGYSTEYSVNED